jgi:hypothetical protein
LKHYCNSNGVRAIADLQRNDLPDIRTLHLSVSHGQTAISFVT